MGFKKNGVRKKVGVKKNVPIIFFLNDFFCEFLTENEMSFNIFLWGYKEIDKISSSFGEIRSSYGDIKK